MPLYVVYSDASELLGPVYGIYTDYNTALEMAEQEDQGFERITPDTTHAYFCAQRTPTTWLPHEEAAIQELRVACAHIPSVSLEDVRRTGGTFGFDSYDDYKHWPPLYERVRKVARKRGIRDLGVVRFVAQERYRV